MVTQRGKSHYNNQKFHLFKIFSLLFKKSFTMTNYLVTLLTLTCMMGNANPAPAENHSLCNRIFKSSESCPRQLSYYKKAFFTDLYGNKKEKISFSDYINHFKSVGYGFPSDQIEEQAKFFNRYLFFIIKSTSRKNDILY